MAPRDRRIRPWIRVLSSRKKFRIVCWNNDLCHSLIYTGVGDYPRVEVVVGLKLRMTFQLT